MRKIINKKRTIALIMFVGLIALTQYSCISLTGRMWHTPPMHRKVLITKDIQCFAKGNAAGEFYLSVKADSYQRLLHVENLFISNTMRLPRKSNSFRLYDYSSVPPEKRVITTYENLIFWHETKREFADYEGSFTLYGADTTLHRVDAIPSDYTLVEQPTVSDAKIWVAKESKPDSVPEVILKGIATPFTLVADIVVVPVCFVRLFTQLYGERI